jgi:large subunit ribosomal protein L7/L12
MANEHDISPDNIAAPAYGAPFEEHEEDKLYEVILVSTDRRLRTMSELRRILGISAMQAKEIVDKAPKVVRDSIPIYEAKEIGEKLTEAGAQIEIR